MNARLLVFLLPLLLWACHGSLYPVAPEPPERVTVGSPDPGAPEDPSPSERGPYGGQLVASGTRYLEFLGYTPPGGSYTLYLFPWDAGMAAIPRTGTTARATLVLSNGRQISMTAATNSEDGSLFFYAKPEASFERLNVTIQAEVTVPSGVLTGTFAHPNP